MIIHSQVKQSIRRHLKVDCNEYAYLKKKDYDPYEAMMKLQEISNENQFKKLFSKGQTTRMHGFKSDWNTRQALPPLKQRRVMLKHHLSSQSINHSLEQLTIGQKSTQSVKVIPKLHKPKRLLPIH